MPQNHAPADVASLSQVFLKGAHGSQVQEFCQKKGLFIYRSICLSIYNYLAASLSLCLSIELEINLHVGINI